MKKLFVTMLSILACGAAYALPVGNPSEASLLSDGLIWEGFCGDVCDPCLNWCDAWSFRFGFYGDYVFNRHLETHDDGDDDVGVPKRDIDHFEIYTNAGYLAFNFWDRFDVFATLGSTNFFLETDGAAFLVDGSRVKLETNSHFSWSVGARATLWECGCTSLGIEGQYFRTNPRVKFVSFGDDESIYLDDSLRARYHEWQVGLGISHRINMFVPYIAVKWSRARVRYNDSDVGAIVDGATIFDHRSPKSWGYAVGVSLVDCEKAALTVEGRFADEKALYVNGQIRF